MASNQPAYAPAPEAETPGEWDEFEPSEESAAAHAEAARSRHRLPRQRYVARSSAVLGVAAIAAVGAGGVASAASSVAITDAGPVPISLPDAVPVDVPLAGTPSYDPTAVSRAREDGGGDRDRTAAPAADPGEALRTRIIEQVTRQRDAAAQAERDATAKIAAAEAARDAAAQKVREQVAAAKAAAEAKTQADADAAAQAEADRLAHLAASYLKPLASYTLTAGFGESDPWANTHTGQDFDAPTGTPVHAIHSGTVTSAGWAGAYGYRVVLRLDDGTELWYCHLSTMVVTSGEVTTGETIGRVGATGNVPSPHLHLEVRPSGGAPVDPIPWLHTHGIPV